MVMPARMPSIGLIRQAERIVAQYNPKEFSLDKSVPWQSKLSHHDLVKLAGALHVLLVATRRGFKSVEGLKVETEAGE